MSLIQNTNITAQDTGSIDAFGRWRVSEQMQELLQLYTKINEANTTTN